VNLLDLKLFLEDCLLRSKAELIAITFDGGDIHFMFSRGDRQLTRLVPAVEIEQVRDPAWPLNKLLHDVERHLGPLDPNPGIDTSGDLV